MTAPMQVTDAMVAKADTRAPGVKTDGRISREILLAWLSFDPMTGIFTWRKNCGRRHKYGQVAGNRHDDGYIKIQVNGCRFAAHRLAWFYVYGHWPSGQIDHIDGDRANNQIKNLRLATYQENNRNKKWRSDNKSGYRGVSWNHSVGKWQAFIGIGGGKNKNLGYFQDAERASRAYQSAAIELFGEFYAGEKLG